MANKVSAEQLQRLEERVASEAAECAEHMNLEAEGVEPGDVDDDLLGEWAEDWFHNNGVPALEFAMEKHGTELGEDGERLREKLYGQMRKAFVRAFIPALQKRLDGAA